MIGIGLVVNVIRDVLPLQPFADGTTKILEETAVEGVNVAISPVPILANPIEGLAFVQL